MVGGRGTGMAGHNGQRGHRQFRCNCESMHVQRVGFDEREFQHSACSMAPVQREACKTPDAVRLAAHQLLRSVRARSTAKIAGKAGQRARAGGAMVAGACGCAGRRWNCARQ